jgi:hypothetical protein
LLIQYAVSKNLDFFYPEEIIEGLLNNPDERRRFANFLNEEKIDGDVARKALSDALNKISDRKHPNKKENDTIITQILSLRDISASQEEVLSPKTAPRQKQDSTRRLGEEKKKYVFKPAPPREIESPQVQPQTPESNTTQTRPIPPDQESGLVLVPQPTSPENVPHPKINTPASFIFTPSNQMLANVGGTFHTVYANKDNIPFIYTVSGETKRVFINHHYPSQGSVAKDSKMDIPDIRSGIGGRV